MMQRLREKALAVVEKAVEKAKARFWPSLKPALFAALWTFLGVFGSTLVGWLEAVAGWLEMFGTPEAGEFPDPSVVGKAFVAGVTAAFAGLTSFVARMIGAAKPPTYSER